MSVATPVTLGFRCKKCWQLTSATSDQVGSEVPCIRCQSPVVVPEVDEKLIAAGEELLESSAFGEPTDFGFGEPAVEGQTYSEFEQAMQVAPQPTPIGLPASRVKRFFGLVVDGMAGAIAGVIGFILAMVIAPEVGLASTLMIATLPVMLTLIQCNLIATEGRTIGKYCVGTKIINARGEAPGFLQGVLIRTIATAFLGMIPFFSLVDSLWIFAGDSNRCLHDILAGTQVVDA